MSPISPFSKSLAARMAGALHRLFRRSAVPTDKAVQLRLVQKPLIIGIVLAAVTLGGGGFAIWDLHRREIQQSRSEMRDLGIVLAAQESGSIQLIDILLREIQSRTRDLGIHTVGEFRQRLGDADTHRLLNDRLKNLPHARATGVFDAEGTLVNTSRENSSPGFSIANRDYFGQARDHAGDEIIVSNPIADRGTGPMSTFFARRISGPDGIFLGLVVASIDVDYLLQLYRTINQERGVAVTLLRRDGIMLARYPTIAVNGQFMPRESEWHKRVAAGGGTYRSPGYFSGVSAIVSANPLRDWPLVINVSVHEEDVLAMWRRQAVFMAAGAIVLSAVFVTLFWMIGRQMRRQADQNARLGHSAEALRASERKLKAFAEMTADWFWEQGPDLRYLRDALIPLTSLPTDVGKTRWDFADPAMDPHRWDSHKADLAARRQFRDFRWERIQTDGNRRYMSTSGDPIFDASGEFSGYHGTGRDITGEVRAAAEARATKDRAEKSETLLRDALDSMSEGVVIYDAEDRFVMCNNSYRETYRQIYAGGADRLLPGVRLEDILRYAVAHGGGGAAARGRETEWVAERLRYHRLASGAYEHRLEDGSWVLVTNRRMKNGGIAGVRIDITALKTAQAAL